MSVAAEFVRAHQSRHLDELKDILRIPSISTDPARAKDVQRAAEWVEARLKRAGCTKTQIYPTSRHPIVYGEWLGAPGKPTLLSPVRIMCCPVRNADRPAVQHCSP